MLADLFEWLNLALRWLHLITGIAWIGSSFYFVWLDNHLVPPREGEASGELWSVHGGGFYHKQKYLVAPKSMPEDLHWFKWEAYFTWLSGFSLLVLVYYLGASAYLIDPAKLALAPWQAVLIGLSTLVLGWVVYDGLCRSPLGRDPRLLGIIWFGVVVAVAWGLNQIFSGRGAYLHVGAMLGTVMAANVLMVIIPGQRKVVAALVAGQTPDPAYGVRGKQRSVHNNYMTLPVLLIMLSHHYPMTFGAQRPWLVLALLGATGVAIRHVFNLRHKYKETRPMMALATVLALASVGYVEWERHGAAPVAAPAPVPAGVTYADVQPIFARHCLACHSPHPTNADFASPPLGVMLDTPEHAASVAARIKANAVTAEVMPLGNTTGITRAERDRLGAWIDGGAKP